MGLAAPSLTIGVEEEYLLVERESRDLANDPPAELMQACTDRLGSKVAGEFLKSQLEIGTGVCRTVTQARAELAELRQCVADVAAQMKLVANHCARENRQRCTHQGRWDHEDPESDRKTKESQQPKALTPRFDDPSIDPGNLTENPRQDETY